MGPAADQPLPCQLCREKHLRCELPEGYTPEPGVELPPCNRCAVSGRRCVRSRPVRFKFFSPDADHPWVQLPRRFYFVNETAEIQAFYIFQSGVVQYPFTSKPPSDPGSPVVQPRQVTGTKHEQHEQHDQHEKHEQLQQLQQQHEHHEHVATIRKESSLGASSTPASQDSDPSLSTRRVYTPVPLGSTIGLANRAGHGEVAFPLLDRAEVRLMKYYIETMCNWFDLCDDEKHFAWEVPRRAITSPPLLKAIFALSSRHLSMNEQFDPYAADRYQQECLNHLAVIYKDATALANDELLAATILLRTLEEMDVPLIGADHELHLHGFQLFMNFPDPTLSAASSLRRACFWIGLRQEILMAFVNQRPVKIKLDHPFVDRSLTPTNDDNWANRIILHCADVLRFCFDSEAEQRVSEYQMLKEYDEAWLRARPVSFLPLAYSEPDPVMGEVFPQVLYLNSSVVIGNAYAIFARALLMCYDPTVPRIGPGQKLAQQNLDETIRAEVRMLCATALSNPIVVPAMFTASMAVTMCGDRFSEDVERRALLDVLIRTEVVHFWPTGGAQDHLKKAWGWAVA